MLSQQAKSVLLEQLAPLRIGGHQLGDGPSEQLGTPRRNTEPLQAWGVVIGGIPDPRAGTRNPAGHGLEQGELNIVRPRGRQARVRMGLRLDHLSPRYASL